jgi:hypothetical protein
MRIVIIPRRQTRRPLSKLPIAAIPAVHSLCRFDSFMRDVKNLCKPLASFYRPHLSSDVGFPAAGERLPETSGERVSGGRWSLAFYCGGSFRTRSASPSNRLNSLRTSRRRNGSVVAFNFSTFSSIFRCNAVKLRNISVGLPKNIFYRKGPHQRQCQGSCLGTA